MFCAFFAVSTVEERAGSKLLNGMACADEVTAFSPLRPIPARITNLKPVFMIASVVEPKVWSTQRPKICSLGVERPMKNWFIFRLTAAI
jgi:hypothetical protein